MTVDDLGGTTNESVPRSSDTIEKRPAIDDVSCGLLPKKPKPGDDMATSADAAESPCAPQNSVAMSITPPTAPTSPKIEGRRPRRSAAAFGRAVAEQAKAKKPKIKKAKVEDTEEEFNTAWICTECNEAECLMASDADQLLICEGHCRRLFHYPCAGLSNSPSEAESFVCQDCQQGRHMCSFCHTYGDDDDDVFPCSFAKCGLFFHEACLEINGVGVKLIVTNESNQRSNGDETDEDEMEISTRRCRREFQCPAHHCWTCTQPDMLEQDKKEASESRKAGKNKGRKKCSGSLFVQKTNQILIRCLACPKSYHTSCIPPTARFNELSLLCPEHVATHRLPEVDPEMSMQTAIEKKIDSKFSSGDSLSRRREKKLYKTNPFFYGRSGRLLSKGEIELTKDLGTETKYGMIGELCFALPMKFRDQVHSKPPFYKHIHGNKYNPDDSPDRIQLPTEVCNCVHHCDESCINRLLYVECRRDRGVTGTNCAVGKFCGNRDLAQRQFKKCQPRREGGKGWGLVVLEDVQKGDLIIEYAGEVINEKEKEKRLKLWSEEHPNDPNFYIMGLGKGWYVDARTEANFARFINHSCDPNSIVHTINVNGYLRNGIFALRDIRAGTFLSYDYHFETMRGDRFVCRCGSSNCRGTMKDHVVEDDSERTKREIWEAAKRDYDKDKAFLDDFHSKQAKRQSNVDAMVPEWEFPSELVANGPPARHRGDAIRGRLFLWRNAEVGSNFAARFARLDRRRTPASTK